jgi:hypothetical protein
MPLITSAIAVSMRRVPLVKPRFGTPPAVFAGCCDLFPCPMPHLNHCHCNYTHRGAWRRRHVQSEAAGSGLKPLITLIHHCGHSGFGMRYEISIFVWVSMIFVHHVSWYQQLSNSHGSAAVSSQMNSRLQEWVSYK